MGNFFLSQFPEPGFSSDYIDNINIIFKEISEHNHNDDTALPVLSSSINWDYTTNNQELLNCGNINFYNVKDNLLSSTNQPLNTLYVFKGDLFYLNSNGVNVQITKQGLLNASNSINGIYGNLVQFNASATYISPSLWEFKGLGTYADIKVFSLDANLLNLENIISEGVSLDNPIQYTVGNKYVYFDPIGDYVYSNRVIKKDRTTRATEIQMKNSITYLQNAFGTPSFPNLADLTVFGKIYDKDNNEKNLYSYNGVFFNQFVTKNKKSTMIRRIISDKTNNNIKLENNMYRIEFPVGFKIQQYFFSMYTEADFISRVRNQNDFWMENLNSTVETIFIQNDMTMHPSDEFDFTVIYEGDDV